MVYGVIQIGRIALREDSAVDVSSGDFGMTLNLSGQESMPRVSLIQLQQRIDDVVALNGRFLPVTFSHKPELDGFYWCESASGTYDKWMPDNVGVMPWSLSLSRAGYAADTDIESRLAGPQTRANTHSGVGERWHAPAIGHLAYSAGGSAPGVMTRTGAEGAMTVYRSLPLNVNPRWGSTPAGYLAGRCRLLDQNGLERVSDRPLLSSTGWEISNGLVKFSVNSGTGFFNISAYTGSWKSKLWELLHSTGPAVTLGVPDYVTVIRNEMEAVIVRLIKTITGGRVTVDVTLRRGSRFLEIYVQHQFGTTLKLSRTTAEAGTASTGYTVATAADADGNKYIIGSSKSFTSDNVQGGISKAATPSLDAFIGVVIAAAPSGDTAANLFSQYLGSPSEMVQGVRR